MSFLGCFKQDPGDRLFEGRLGVAYQTSAEVRRIGIDGILGRNAGRIVEEFANANAEAEDGEGGDRVVAEGGGGVVGVGSKHGGEAPDGSIGGGWVFIGLRDFNHSSLTISIGKPSGHVSPTKPVMVRV